MGATPAPPSENIRSEPRSVLANDGWSIIVRMNTGVEIITAIASRSTRSRARPGSHVSISTVVIALVAGSRTPYVSPATCVTGIGRSSDSPGVVACAAAIVSASTRSDWCVWTTPLGSEVVPDVQRINAVVSASTDGRSGGSAASGSASGPRITSTSPSKPVARTMAV